mmetsp:Transcript_11080/g.24415  ORF Transcript_11080/g.24415 Transcript_11080/m.24415 type:complete len:505 (-) Transcript_11080:429-1943(-)|eukprot:CAMPEP_0206446072 /NCGR_PEP_ID=MMETSP0324_2-20121206/15913_1 /ASSEMBLY_ACC=CAM_ASM_000836 /TAXON_ID=2866 /ORGANISM="Crypthecodinium cohnii, Strain Seligo" /LENGTH=504 /DNA_ID=CAMNT_0053914463 /DNA_START=48 /DNA_END=1562 /DNA_ORIENTATION=-
MPESKAKTRSAASGVPLKQKRKSVQVMNLNTKRVAAARKSTSNAPLKRSTSKFALEDPESLGVDSKILKEYEVEMKKMVKRGHIPGFASVVMRHGKVIHTMEHGWADLEHERPFHLDTLCRLICMTKSYIATAFMTLVEEGRVDLEDTLEKYLPCFKNIQVLKEDGKKSKPKEQIRLKHIIAHTSGIGYPPDIGEPLDDETSKSYAALQAAVQKGTVSCLRDFTERLSKIPLLSHPGETYEYGFSMDVLARVIEVIMKKDIEECLQERVFQPLGMTDTIWHVDPNELHRLAACYAGARTWGNLYGHHQKKVPTTSKPGLVRIDGDAPHASNWKKGRHCNVKSGGGFMGYTCGGLVSTVADTVKFVQMLVSRGIAPDGSRFLREKTLATMEKNRLKPAWGKGSACFLGNIGVFREGGNEFGMGGAACTYWSVDREDGVACVWFTQHTDMPEITDIPGINAKRADIWQAMYEAVRTKAVRSANTKLQKKLQLLKRARSRSSQALVA